MIAPEFEITVLREAESVADQGTGSEGRKGPEKFHQVGFHEESKFGFSAVGLRGEWTPHSHWISKEAVPDCPDQDFIIGVSDCLSMTMPA